MSIYENERYGLDIDNPEIEDEESLSPKNSESDYTTDNIKVEPHQYSIYELKRKFDRVICHKDSNDEYSERDLRNQIILDSEFQRGEVWDRKQQSELIESVLMGLPLPLMYFFEDKNANLIVVDGRQRLTAFFKYMDDDYRLSGLEILDKLNGDKFSGLEPISQSKLEDFQLMVQIIKPPTPDRVKFQIFDRVNRGGTPLNNQEMRNALYQGNSTILLKRLSESHEFQKAIGYGINPKRMKDRYVILRSISFYLLRKKMIIDPKEKPIEYKGALDDLLGKTMDFLNKQDEKYLENIEKVFLEAMNLTTEILDENAFRLTKTNQRKSPINMNILEVWTYLMILLADREVSHLELKETYEELIENPKFIKSIRSIGSHRDSPGKVNERYSIVEDIFKGVTSDDK